MYPLMNFYVICDDYSHLAALSTGLVYHGSYMFLGYEYRPVKYFHHAVNIFVLVTNLKNIVEFIYYFNWIYIIALLRFLKTQSRYVYHTLMFFHACAHLNIIFNIIYNEYTLLGYQFRQTD